MRKKQKIVSEIELLLKVQCGGEGGEGKDQMEGKWLLLIVFTNALAIRRRPCPMFALGHANPQSSKASLTHLHAFPYCTVPRYLTELSSDWAG